MLVQLGAPVLVTGLLGGSNGDFIATELDARGIEHAFVRIAGNTRVYSDSGRGCRLRCWQGDRKMSPAAELEGFFSHVPAPAPRAKIVTLSGGAPAGPCRRGHIWAIN